MAHSKLKTVANLNLPDSKLEFPCIKSQSFNRSRFRNKCSFKEQSIRNYNTISVIKSNECARMSRM